MFDDLTACFDLILGACIEKPSVSLIAFCKAGHHRSTGLTVMLLMYGTRTLSFHALMNLMLGLRHRTNFNEHYQGIKVPFAVMIAWYREYLVTNQRWGRYNPYP